MEVGKVIAALGGSRVGSPQMGGRPGGLTWQADLPERYRALYSETGSTLDLLE
jgi:hypothetical protein